MPVAHHPPANLKDFDRGKDPNALYAGWDQLITDLVEPRPSRPAWYDAAHPPVPAMPSTRIAAWQGLPRLSLLFHQDNVLAAANAVDAPVPFAGATDALLGSEGPFFNPSGDPIGGVSYRPQDEYLEWVTKRDPDGVVREVWFTCESPEYWKHIADNDPHLLVMLYAEIMEVNASKIDRSKLFFATNVSQHETFDSGRRYAKGSYNPFNDYNAGAAIHLTHPANTLTFEIELASKASLIWGRPPKTSDPGLICCANYGDPNRFSDPTIGKAVNDLAQAGSYVSLRDPVGVYIASIDAANFTDWNGHSVPNLAADFFVRLRMSDDGSMAVRARFKVPPGVQRNGAQARLGDFMYQGSAIQSGGQVADAVIMRLFAQCLPGAPHQPERQCTNHCCDDPNYPGVIGSVDIATSCEAWAPGAISPALPDTLEPTIPRDEVQGNILLGFNKNHQAVTGLSLGANVAGFRSFIAGLADRITTVETVANYRATRAFRQAQGQEPDYPVLEWTSVAFSFAGLRLLTPEADGFGDGPFRDGLPKSSARLGDPTDFVSPGYICNWKVGCPGEVPDVLVTMASDNLKQLREETDILNSKARATGMKVVYQEIGHNLRNFPWNGPKPSSSREHFGFKDGLSQPGVRGKLPDGSYLTPREPSAPGSDPTDIEYAKPGQPLVCLGQFLLGYSRQLDNSPRAAGPPRPLGAGHGAIGPTWAKNGSFLVFRRLRQDVGAFRAFLSSAATKINLPEFSEARLAAMFVGRWPSGAPLLRSPRTDELSEAEKSVVNAFAYGSDNVRLDLPDDTDGILCPIVSHVRKVNPRDADTGRGAGSATLMRRILRRGIPYGPPFTRDTSDVDRGLLFLSYQASIGDQFEFLCTHWMNSTVLPPNPSGSSAGTGFDMVVGQSAGNRLRSAFIRTTTATSIADVAISNDPVATKDWVIPTGGGYFFAPSVSAVRWLAGTV